jgi:hypothetical protein
MENHTTLGNYANDSRYNIENAVVAQKDDILSNCNQGEWVTVLDKLDVVAPVWIACDYAYKGNEIAQRVRDGVDRVLWELSSGLKNGNLKTAASRRERRYLESNRARAIASSAQFLNAPQYVGK